MSTSLPQFVQDLADSGLMSDERLRAFEDVMSRDLPDDPQVLAEQLVNAGLLTSYQAEEALAGRGRSLVLGNYEIMEKIGQGGMGMVVKARHRRMDRIVALKLLPPATTATPEKLRRFQREVRTAAKLVHHNIVTAYDADEAGSTHFLVMEYVEGEDLLTVTRRDHPMPVERAVGYIIQAARGLEYAHEQGVVHRDIKPANLLLSADGTIKILDMGLARLSGAVDDEASDGDGDTDEKSTAEGLTVEGSFMGTVDYMAPEQAMDTSSVDHRVDMYALGATLFRILCNRPMYDIEGVVKKIMAHREAPIPSLRQFRDDIPLELDVIYQKMVAKKPEHRYQTMAEVIRDLRDAVIFPAAKPVAQGQGAKAVRAVGGTGVSVQQVRDEPTQVLPINEQTEVIRRPGPLDQLGEAHARHREKTATTRGRMPRSKRKRTGQYILFGVVMMVLLVLSGVYIMMSTPTPRSTEDVQVAMAEPGKWTELLENVELDGFVLNGPWKHDEKAIYSPRGRLSALGFPVKFPDSYRIELVVEPKEPATLVIGLAQHNEPFAVTIDRRVEGKVISGIGPQREAGPLVTQEGHAGQLLAVDRSNLISIQVTRNSIRAICANELVVDTDVPPPTPKSGSSKSPFPQRRMPYLMTTGQIYIHRMSMTALTPATPTGVAEAGNKPVSLLAKVDRSQAPSLRFEPKVDAITTPIAPVAADINYVLPDEYVLEFRVEREPHDARKAPRPVNAANGPRGGGGLAIGLTDHGYPFTVYLNWDRDQIVWADPVGSPLVYGIGYVDDRPDSKLVVGEDRGEAGWLQRNITSTVRVEVAREGITVKVDGTPMVEWKGEASMLWDEQKPEPLKTGYPWLRSTGVYRVSRMTLTPTVTANPTEQTAANTQPLKEQAAGTPGPTVSSAPATAVKKAK